MLGKPFKSSDIAGWASWDRLFSNLRLHLSETQYSSDITSKIRIKRNIFEPPHLSQKQFTTFLMSKIGKRSKKYWWIYIDKK